MSYSLTAPGAKHKKSKAPNVTMRTLNNLLVIGLCLLVWSCTSHQQKLCSPGLSSAIQESLYFGTNRPDGSVSEQEWQNFLNTVITPRFPAGLTETNASGQWQEQSGTITQEQSHILTIIHSGSTAENTAIEQLIEIYKKNFQQEAVLRVRNDVCVSF